MRIALLVLLISWLSTDPALAQARVARPDASVLFNVPHHGPLRFLASNAPRDTLRAEIRPTYWKEGALIGGILGLVGGAVLGHGLCDLSETQKNCTGGLLLGGALGAVLLAIPGALIGGQFPKHEEGADL